MIKTERKVLKKVGPDWIYIDNDLTFEEYQKTIGIFIPNAIGEGIRHLFYLPQLLHAYPSKQIAFFTELRLLEKLPVLELLKTSVHAKYIIGLKRISHWYDGGKFNYNAKSLPPFFLTERQLTSGVNLYPFQKYFNLEPLNVTLPKRPFVTVQPTTSRFRNKWKDTYCSYLPSLINRLARAFTVILIGTNEDSEIVKDMYEDKLLTKNTIDFMGKTSLIQAIQIVLASDFVIGMDSWVALLASTHNVPSIWVWRKKTFRKKRRIGAYTEQVFDPAKLLNVSVSANYKDDIISWINQYPSQKYNNDNLFIILSDRSVSICDYHKPVSHNNSLSKNQIIKALKFADTNNFQPVFIYPEEMLDDSIEKLLSSIHCYKIIPFTRYNQNESDSVVVFDKIPDKDINHTFKCVLLTIEIDQLIYLYKWICAFIGKSQRIEVCLRGISDYTDINVLTYQKQLSYIADRIIVEIQSSRKAWFGKQIPFINILTDKLFLKRMRNCNFGVNNFTLGPDGSFYVCPAYYRDGPKYSIGYLDKDFMSSNRDSYHLDNWSDCLACRAYQCNRCIYLLKDKKPGNIETNTCKIRGIELAETKKIYLCLSKMVRKTLSLHNLNVEHAILFFKNYWH